MKNRTWLCVVGCTLSVVGSWALVSYKPAPGAADEITVPAGFKATVFADKLGRARHLTVNTNGDVYVKLDKLKDGKGIMRLRDADGDGVAENSSGFVNFTGTGIKIKDGYLYASSDDEVFRYKLGPDGPLNGEEKERVVTGLVNKGQHAAKAITLDDAGNLYVNVGAPSNDCQEKDRAKGSPGLSPCPILETAGGIWQFKASGQDQSYEIGRAHV